jgi:HEPN domain-containing protein
MTNISLAQSYLIKATKRLKILPVLLAEQAYSDVVREAQEIVELALKGMLRQAGVDPPKWHDVYGDIDFIPTEQYVKKDAQKAIRDANFTARIVGKVVKLP